MKLTFSLLVGIVCFFSNARAGSEQPLHVATRELNHIQDLTNNLTDVIKAWDVTSLTFALNNIHAIANDTVTYVLHAAEVLKKHPTTFDNTQAFKIGTPTQRLAYAVNASIAALNGRKRSFDEAQINEIAISDVQNLLDASSEFSDVLISFVPNNLRPIAENVKAQIINSLQQGLGCFNNISSACSLAVVDADRTYDLAVRYNAMRKDGSPIV